MSNGTYSTYLRLWTSLQLSLDRPGKHWLAVHGKDFVCDLGVFVLRVDQQPVHVEETRTNAWETVMDVNTRFEVVNGWSYVLFALSHNEIVV